MPVSKSKMWVTLITAIDPTDGKLKLWMGPNVPGEDVAAAERYCHENDLGYCVVAGTFDMEIGWDSALFATNLENDN